MSSTLSTSSTPLARPPAPPPAPASEPSNTSTGGLANQKKKLNKKRRDRDRTVTQSTSVDLGKTPPKGLKGSAGVKVGVDPRKDLGDKILEEVRGKEPSDGMEGVLGRSQEATKLPSKAAEEMGNTANTVVSSSGSSALDDRKPPQAATASSVQAEEEDKEEIELDKSKQILNLDARSHAESEDTPKADETTSTVDVPVERPVKVTSPALFTAGESISASLNGLPAVTLANGTGTQRPLDEPNAREQTATDAAEGSNDPKYEVGPKSDATSSTVEMRVVDIICDSSVETIEAAVQLVLLGRRVLEARCTGIQPSARTEAEANKLRSSATIRRGVDFYVSLYGDFARDNTDNITQRRYATALRSVLETIKVIQITMTDLDLHFLAHWSRDSSGNAKSSLTQQKRIKRLPFLPVITSDMLRLHASDHILLEAIKGDPCFSLVSRPAQMGGSANDMGASGPGLGPATRAIFLGLLDKSALKFVAWDLKGIEARPTLESALCDLSNELTGMRAMLHEVTQGIHRLSTSGKSEHLAAISVDSFCEYAIKQKQQPSILGKLDALIVGPVLALFGAHAAPSPASLATSEEPVPWANEFVNADHQAACHNVERAYQRVQQLQQSFEPLWGLQVEGYRYGSDLPIICRAADFVLHSTHTAAFPTVAHLPPAAKLRAGRKPLAARLVEISAEVAKNEGSEIDGTVDSEVEGHPAA